MTNPSRLDTHTDPCQATRGWWQFPHIAEVRTQVQVMHEAARTLLEAPGREAFWCQCWEFSVLKAAGNEASNKKQYYLLRFVALFSVLLASTFAAISASATGDDLGWIRWATFVVSLIAAASTGAIAIFRPVERWLVYRKLQAALMEVGWTLIASVDVGAAESTSSAAERPAAPAKTDPWSVFRSDTEALQRKYEKDYVTFLIAPGMEHSNSDDHGPAVAQAGQQSKV